MKHNDLSVFDMSYLNKKYVLLHKPWKFATHFLSGLRAAKRRASEGYCTSDWSNFNDWFCSIIPAMLREWAEKAVSYSHVNDQEPEEATPESWAAWLNKIADQIEYAGSDTDSENEFAEAFFSKVGTDQELNKKYFAREQELLEKRRDAIKEAFTELANNWETLWD